MNHPLRNDDEDQIQVWKRSLPEDEEESTDSEMRGVLATVAVACGVIITVIVAAVIGGILFFDKYKHHIGF